MSTDLKRNFHGSRERRVYMSFGRPTVGYQNLRAWPTFFNIFNPIDSGLQGPSGNVLTSIDELSAFQEKISVWCANLNQGINTATFPLLTGQRNSNSAILGTIRSHLQALQMSLKFYLPDLNVVRQYDWVRNTFASTMQTDVTVRYNRKLWN